MILPKLIRCRRARLRPKMATNHARRLMPQYKADWGLDRSCGLRMRVRSFVLFCVVQYGSWWHRCTCFRMLHRPSRPGFVGLAVGVRKTFICQSAELASGAEVNPLRSSD